MIKHNGFLLLTVQEGASGFNIVNSLNPPHFEWEYPVDGDDPGTYDCADLPPGSWQLIGLASELTEEQWREIVDKIKGGYECYDLLIYGAPYQPMDTATKSGRSLLTRHKLSANTTVILKQIEV